MPARIGIARWALLLAGTIPLAADSDSFASRLLNYPRAYLCVTEGTIPELPGDRLAVSTPKMRAYLNVLPHQLWNLDSLIWA